MPTRYGYIKTLDTQYNKMKNLLINRLSKQKYICMTADVWSSRCQSYLGVTAHFINMQTFKRESYVIGFKRLYFKQTNDELARAINQLFSDFEIRTGQVTNIVWREQFLQNVQSLRKTIGRICVRK